MDRSTVAEPGGLSEEDAIGLFSASRVAMVVTNPALEDNPIVYVNRAFETLTGYSQDMALGRNCRFLQGPDTKKAHVRTIREALDDAEDVSVTILNYRADGSPFYNSLLISPIVDEQSERPVYFLGLQREVRSDREADAVSSVESLVTEVQHRVKNHLSMIVGLIRMQARKSTSPEEFTDVSRRVESLQLLYEEMTAHSNTSNRDEVKLGAYLGRVAAAIAHIDGRAGVRMNIDVAPVMVDTETAVRIGLIVSEILTNAMQHAFEDQDSGLVELRVTETDDGGVRVIVSDDGVGMPEDFEWPNSDSLGGRIVKGLCDGLGATLNVSRGAVGTVITFDVPHVRQ